MTMETINRQHRYQLSDVLTQYGPSYMVHNSLCSVQLKAYNDITACRTAKLKGHLSRCNHCGYKEQSYNSCRNRHCNKCQYTKQVTWAEQLKARLLPVKYFHLVFTVPDSLNKLFYINQQHCYNVLFKAAWSTIKDLCANNKLLGVKPGAVAILHTWTSTMTYHPHLHFLVTAGGVDEDMMEWNHSKKGYLLPVKVVSKVYRARIIAALNELINKKALELPDQMTWGALKQQLFKKQWVVYAKKTGKDHNHTIEYLARYTNRVAIGNNRIVDVCHGKVTFRYKHPKTGKYNCEMTLDAHEFIRRFMQHVLPLGFYKIRYFGIFASANSNAKEQCFALIDENTQLSQTEGLNQFEAIKILLKKDLTLCKKCKKGRMVLALPGS